MDDAGSIDVLFLAKHGDAHVSRALGFVQDNFRSVVAYHADWGDPLPEDIGQWRPDYVISYLSRWVVPENLLAKARTAAINFHPAPPEYPGIGCTNFALYDDVREYGATCHHMAPKVDTGRIIAVSRFPVFSTDTVASLLARTYDYQLVLFYDIISRVLNGEGLPESTETWTREPISRREFNELGRITLGMSDEEIRRRVRATSYGIWQPSIELAGLTFALKPESDG